MFVKYSLKVFAMFSGSVISCSPSLVIHRVALGTLVHPVDTFHADALTVAVDIYGVLFDDTLVEGRFCCVFRHTL